MGSRVSGHQSLLVLSVQPSLPPGGQGGSEAVSLHEAVTEKPQFDGGVGVTAVDPTAVKVGGVGVDLLSGSSFCTYWIRPRELKAILFLPVVEAVIRDINVEAVPQLFVVLFVLLKGSRQTALEIWE